MRQMDLINYRLQTALCLPPLQRCDELNKLINETSYKDLKDAFPIILESAFGIPGWGLRTIDKNSNITDVDAMLRFLDPMGPLFMLAYQLGTDYFLKYDLSLNCLPPKLKQDLETGVVTSAIFCEKLHIDPHTRRPSALLLSPFKLLIFRFALHVLPKLQPEVWVDAAYTQLVERYLCHFLPCDPQAPPVLPNIPYLTQAQHSHQTTSPFAAHSTPTKQEQQFTLLKSSVNMGFSANSPSSVTAPTTQNPLMEIWRTRILTQVLIHLWLTVDVASTMSPVQLRHYTSGAVTPTLCSAEHARMVRCFIKHMHYFANSACGTNSTAMDEMKRQILPLSKVQIYQYLSYTMKNWPLDTSFRVILEAWLSYIQPWRYTNLGNYSRQENEESGRPVDRKWQMFIAEHLPVYTLIFQQLLDRFQRLDFASLKNVIMLHRLTKVFSLENFREMLSEVEESYLGYRPLSPFSQSAATSTGFSHSNTLASSLDAQPQARWQSAAMRALHELEGKDATYEALFGQETKIKVRALLEDTLVAAKHRASELAQQQKQRQTNTGFWNFLFGPSDVEMEEYTLEDRHRVVQILQYTSEQLCNIFQLHDIHPVPVNAGDDSVSTSGSAHLNTTFLNDSTLQSSFSSPTMSLQYEGDPDKMLICPNEVAWLVRMFYEISGIINRQYSLEIQVLHTRQDIWGRFARQILQPPRTIYLYEKGKEGYKIRKEKFLPARLSLRSLAKKKFVALLFVLCGVFWLFGYHPIMGLIPPMFFYFCMISIHALME